jgi:putative transposase
VAYSDPKAPLKWSDDEVAEKWLTLYPGKLNDPAKAEQRAAKKAAIMADEERLATYRERLGSLSWLMRCVNEPIAKQSNAEDFCKGHFYEYLPWYSPYGPSSFLQCSNWFQCVLT